MDRDQQLLDWFRALYAARTPPASVQDAHPDYRVTWSETAAKMKELGYGDSATDNRILFAGLFAKHKLRAYCNRLIRATGSKTLMSAESETSKDIRRQYGV